MFKEAARYVLIGVISIAVITGGAFALGKFDNFMLSTIGKEKANIKRDIYKESKSYVEGMVSDLSNYKREFERTDDVNEKEQIANMIDTEFSNFDITNIESQSLYNFLLDIREGNWR